MRTQAHFLELLEPFRVVKADWPRRLGRLGGQEMLKRGYLLLSMAALLATITAFAQNSSSDQDAQKDKEKEKAVAKDKAKEKEEGHFALLSEQTFPFVLGEGGYLGVYLEEVTADRAKELKLSEERGAIVMKVIDDSPAAKAGLKENDVIVSYNGRRVDTVRELQRLLSETPPDRSVAFEVIRDGRRNTVSATLGRRSQDLNLFRYQGKLAADAARESMKRAEESMKRAQESMKQREKALERSGKLFEEFGQFDFVGPRLFMSFRGGRLGIGVESLGDQLADYFGLKGGRGVLVTEVRENSPAAKAGLKAGDVITAVDNEKVEDVTALLRALGKKQEGQVTLSIVRDRAEQTITVTLEKREPAQIRRPRATKVSAVAWTV
jgi:membrane-associated protease RseP (regulator of RpoE activity)